MNDTTDPAYPHTYPDGCTYSGLTKREHFAALAMQGLVANPYDHASHPAFAVLVEQTTLAAVAYADALIAALNAK